MGRELDAIEVPNDGPLRLLLGQQYGDAMMNRNDEKDNECNIADLTIHHDDLSPGMSQTMKLFALAYHTTNQQQTNMDNNSNSNNDNDMHTKTIKELKQAPSIRQQLAILRTYRSMLLNSKKQTNNNSQHEVGMYRFLIEFGFSIHTPHALKRASESCLAALIQIQKAKDDAGSVPSPVPGLGIYKSINEAVVQSIFQKQMWKNPTQTLFDVLDFKPTMDVILSHNNLIMNLLQVLIAEGEDVERIISDYYHSCCHASNNDVNTNNTNSNTNHPAQAERQNTAQVVGVVGVQVVNAVERGLEICNTLKLFLKDFSWKRHSSSNSNSVCSTESTFRIEFKNILIILLERVVVPLIRCKATSSDSLSVCTVTLGQILFLLWELDGCDDQEIAMHVKNVVGGISGQHSNVDGNGNGGAFVHLKASDAMKGLPQLNQVAIVKGLTATLPDSVLAASTDINDTTTSEYVLLVDPIALFVLRIAHVSTENGARLLALRGLETILGRWKNILISTNDANLSQQAREFSNKVLQVALVTWESPPSRQIGSTVPGLFQSLVKLMGVLDQGGSGETKSIDMLVSRVLAQPSTRKGKYVALDALLPKVGASKLIQLADEQGDRSALSSSFIASFLTEIGRSGNSSGAVAELLGKLMSMLRVEMHKEAGIDLSKHQVGNKKERRIKQNIMNKAKEGARSFTYECDGIDEERIVLLESWNRLWVSPLAAALLDSDVFRRNQVASFCLPLLITFVGGKGKRVDAAHAFAILLDEISYQGDHEHNHDAGTLVWAKFEIVRHAQLLRLLKLRPGSSILSKAIAKALPLPLVKTTLFHESSRLRLAAFLSLSSVIFTYDDTPSSDLNCLLLEADLWREALPYSLKCSDKEFIASLTQSLRSFLDRLSDAEARDEDSCGRHLLRFVNRFLLRDIFVKQAAYPGTVAEKEKWALSMIDCILSFASRKATTLLKQRKVSKHSPVRKLLPNQEQWCRDIMVSILSDDVIATLEIMMHSLWDNTRSSAYGVLLDTLDYAKKNELTLPLVFVNAVSIKLFQSRAFHLASSPRQREADTGARMISVLCATQTTRENELDFLKELSRTVQSRVIMMQSSLGICNDDNTGLSSIDDNRLGLPLAHGLIQAIRLIVERVEFGNVPDADKLYESMTRICFQAIELSLVVVADIKENDTDAPSEGDSWKNARAKLGKNVPLNINTGAIGANAAFDSDKKVRLLKQRTIMGTWLLIKEACAALSSITNSSPIKDVGLLSTAGDLLISTLTSLKHQGAAFAAHKSLQKLCSICYSRNNLTKRHLPSEWSEKLLHGVSSAERVRDSTLRRSTGYGLGFLSILRSEEISPRFLFPHILSIIIRLSLPPVSIMEAQLKKWSSSDKEIFVFSKIIASEGVQSFVSDSAYQERSRIHALNILRLVILDAPLAIEMRFFVGDSIIASLIGYKDPSWAIRNSATMCYAAAMLRVVDADKNADMTLGTMKDKGTTNAVTCKELFRSYPPLATSLLSLIKEENANASFNDSLHPTLFPLLLLLARLQPLSIQRAQTGDDETSKLFVDPLIDCLGHVHHKVRLAAARALVVLCSGDGNSEEDTNSRCSILNRCTMKLSLFKQQNDQVSHNRDHGILLAVKYLLGASTHPEKFVDGRLQQAIHYYAAWCDFTLTSPPFCASAALDAWYIALQIGTADKSTLLETSWKVVRCVEFLSIQDYDSTGVVGLSDLGKAASRITCKIAFTRIFKSSSSSEDRNRCIFIAQHCFQSRNYDVMLHSIKAFKKGVYDAVEDVSRKQSFEVSVKIEILAAIAKLAFNCLSIILSRDGKTAHPPTLRRLSRISIETIHALRSINSSATIHVTDVVEVSPPELWRIASVLLCTSGYEMTGAVEVKPENLSGGNGLAGNALEFAAFAISEMCQYESRGYAELNGYIQTFVNLVHQSTHPLSSWKIRYSGAVAIKECGLVQMSNEDCRKFGPCVEESKLQLCLKLLELFQDSDEDVRFVAGRTVSLSADTLAVPKVSLMNLEQTSLRLTSQYSTLGMYNLLLSRLLSLCSGVQNTINMTITEYNCTLQAPTLDNILNLSTERMIFEEEDANPYEEPLVIMQTAIMRLTEFPFAYGHNNECASAHFGTLQASYEMIIGHIIRISETVYQCPDIVHNITFDGNLFASLHGVILGTAFSLWIGLGDERAVDLAKEVMAMDTVTLHPGISEALQTLIAVREQDAASLKQIREACFLLPACSMHPSKNV